MDRKVVEEKVEQMRHLIDQSLQGPFLSGDFGTKLLDGAFGEEGKIFAAEFLQYAAERGVSNAMFNLGMCYRWGDGGVYADPNEAMVWFEKAAQLGHEEARSMVDSFDSPSGKQMLLMSAMSGVEGAGSKWYKTKVGVDEYYRLAQSGNAEAQYELARQLEDPRHLGPFKHNMEQAIHWYTEAGNNGVVDAMYNLGVIYLKGKNGTRVDLPLARLWFEKCANAGDTEAKQILARADLWVDG